MKEKYWRQIVQDLEAAYIEFKKENCCCLSVLRNLLSFVKSYRGTNINIDVHWKKLTKN